MSVRISTPRMTQEPSIRLWEERIFGLINSLTGLLTVLMAPRPSRELPPPQVPANWAVLRILAQSRKNRMSASRFPEKWGVLGYRGPLPISIVADEPGERSRKHLELGLPYANDVDIFTHPSDQRLYELLKKYELENAHLMDTHISVNTDLDQDRRVFL